MEYRRQAKETGGAALIAVFVAGVHVFLGFDQKSGAILGFFVFLASLYSIQWPLLSGTKLDQNPLSPLRRGQPR